MRQWVMVSDLSGTEIPAGQHVVVTLEFDDGRRSKMELDAMESEVAQLIAAARTVKRRGRPRKTAE